MHQNLTFPKINDILITPKILKFIIMMFRCFIAKIYAKNNSIMILHNQIHSPMAWVLHKSLLREAANKESLMIFQNSKMLFELQTWYSQW